MMREVAGRLGVLHVLRRQRMLRSKYPSECYRDRQTHENFDDDVPFPGFLLPLFGDTCGSEMQRGRHSEKSIIYSII